MSTYLTHFYFQPVDGKGTDITFGSNCVLENYNCEKSDKRKNIKLNWIDENINFFLITAYKKFSDGECEGKAPVRLS